MAQMLLMIATAAAVAGHASGGAPKEQPMPTSIAPRDGNIAIQEELDAARCKATLEAYDLFLARHPGHPLAAVARRERAVVARRQGSVRQP